MPLHVSSTMYSSSGGQICIIQPMVSSHSVGGPQVHRCTGEEGEEGDGDDDDDEVEEEGDDSSSNSSSSSSSSSNNNIKNIVAYHCCSL